MACPYVRHADLSGVREVKIFFGVDVTFALEPTNKLRPA
jgi:hypothetical protein